MFRMAPGRQKIPQVIGIYVAYPRPTGWTKVRLGCALPHDHGELAQLRAGRYPRYWSRVEPGQILQLFGQLLRLKRWPSTTCATNRIMGQLFDMINKETSGGRRSWTIQLRLTRRNVGEGGDSIRGEFRPSMKMVVFHSSSLSTMKPAR